MREGGADLQMDRGKAGVGEVRNGRGGRVGDPYMDGPASTL